jgi:hypothetical protein
LNVGAGTAEPAAEPVSTVRTSGRDGGVRDDAIEEKGARPAGLEDADVRPANQNKICNMQ